jgi:predicted SnoaL-like aldol condensation-catalyzing enzyme
MTDVRNRAVVLQAFEQFAAGDVESLRTVIREDFIEHSPGNPSGRDAFLAFLSAAPVAEARLTLKRLIADDDYVVVHYRMDPPDQPALAVVDIWRLEDGHVVEHWDVVQPVSDPADVPHGMF